MPLDPEIQELDGVRYERRMGLLLPETDPALCSAPRFEDSFEVYSDADIIKILGNPDRTPKAKIFADPTWIKKSDQKQHGSCQGWATAMAYSKTRYLRGTEFQQPGSIFYGSGSYVYSWVNNGQDNGSALDRGMAEIQAHGTCSSDLCDANQIYRPQTSKFDAAALSHLGLACYPTQDQQALKSAAAAGFMIVVALQVNNAFMNWRPISPGIIPVASGAGNHSIHADDLVYQNGTFLWRVCNNWNLTWGYQGWGYASWSSFAQPIKNHGFYVITSTNETA